MKNIFAIIIFILLFLFGCKEKDSDKLKSETEKSQRIIDSLKSEINKDSDRKIFNNAFEMMKNIKYKEAIINFREMNTKYPKSELINESNKNIEICEQKLKDIEKENIKELTEIISKAKTLDVQESISLLKDFKRKKVDLSIELENQIDKELEKYNEEYKKIEADVELEKNYGLKVIKINTYWDELFKPIIRIKIKNTSGRDITGLEMIVQFIDKKKGTIFGDGKCFIQGPGDVPFSNNLIKEKETFTWESLDNIKDVFNLPSLTAKIYFQDLEYNNEDINHRIKNIYYKDVPINKKFGK